MGDDAEQPRRRASTLGERESSTTRLQEAAASFSNVLQVDVDDERAYTGVNFLYHDKLFAFAEAFDLIKPGWSGTPMISAPREISPRRRSQSAGSPKPSSGWRHLWTGRELDPRTVVALRALGICSLVALDRPDTLRAAPLH